MSNKFENYTIQRGDTLRFLLNLLYNCYTNSRSFIYALNRLNDCNLFTERFKIGQTIKMPISFIDDNGQTYYFVYSKRNISLTEEKHKSYCLVCACMNDTNTKLYDLSLGHNNHTQSITLCDRCLELLYHQINDIIKM